MTTTTPNRFPDGTFAPHPQRNTAARMIAAQATIESRLFLRHGEQQLLSLVIPFLVLIGLAKWPPSDLDHPLGIALPLTLAISAMSAGMTGQAIAIAFDRRYGALKRIGASGVPSWTIMVGKVVGVISVSILQTVIMVGTALILGWRTSPEHLLPALVTLIIGVAAFTSLGLLLGGTLPAEIVLALANLIWFLLAGVASYVLLRNNGHVPSWTTIIPSVALADGLENALNGVWPLTHMGVLAGWLVAGAAATNKLFRFTS